MSEPDLGRGEQPLDRGDPRVWAQANRVRLFAMPTHAGRLDPVERPPGSSRRSQWPEGPTRPPRTSASPGHSGRRSEREAEGAREAVSRHSAQGRSSSSQGSNLSRAPMGQAMFRGRATRTARLSDLKCRDARRGRYRAGNCLRKGNGRDRNYRIRPRLTRRSGRLDRTDPDQSDPATNIGRTLSSTTTRVRPIRLSPPEPSAT